MIENTISNGAGEKQLTPSEKLNATLEAEKLEISKEIDKAFDSIIASAPEEPGSKLVGTETFDDLSNLTELEKERVVNPKERYVIFTYKNLDGKIIRKKYSHSGKEGKWTLEPEKTIPTPPAQ